MNSKEKLKSSLNHVSPSGVTVDFGATPVTGIHVLAIEGLRNYYGLEKRPVKVHEPYQMLGIIDDDLAEIMGCDVKGITPRTNMFGIENTGWKEFRTFWGQDVLVSGEFNTSLDAKGDLLIYPAGDKSVAASARMPKSGYFFDSVRRQQPYDENNPLLEDNLEEFGFFSEADIAYWKVKAEEVKTCSKGIILNPGGTALGDIALVPGPWMKNPKGIRDIADWYMSTLTRMDFMQQLFDKQTDIALKNLDTVFKVFGNSIEAIMTERAFENAITTVYAMGGSTNMYLHLLAVAREAQVPVTIERIQAVGERVPLLANLQPHGPFAMGSLHAIGGVPIVMKELLRAGLLHGDVMTVTGKTLAENLAAVPTLEEIGRQEIVSPVSKPVAAANNHISVLKGNLAPESCLLKLSGKTLEKGEFRGTARVFESEADTMAAIRAGEIVAGDVIVVRNVGPVGGPGMPEMVMLTIQLQGRGLGEDVALITDGRFSGVSHGILIGHISPEAARGGPIAAVHEGDTIVINPKARTLTLDVSDDEIARRMASWRAPDRAEKARPGSVHDKYIRLVSSAHHGCVL